jgi:hypothetical protein
MQLVHCGQRTPARRREANTTLGQGGVCENQC